MGQRVYGSEMATAMNAANKATGFRLYRRCAAVANDAVRQVLAVTLYGWSPGSRSLVEVGVGSAGVLDLLRTRPERNVGAERSLSLEFVLTSAVAACPRIDAAVCEAINGDALESSADLTRR